MALAPSGLELGGQFSFDGVGGIVLIGLGILAVVAIGILLMLVIKGVMAYKIPVNVWSRTGSGAIYESDKAKILRNPDTKRPQALQLRRSKIIEEYPGSDYFHPNTRGKPVLNAVIIDNKLTFFKIEELLPDPVSFKKSWKQSDLHGTFAAYKANADKFTPQGFFAKYGSLVMTGMLTVVVLIFMIVVFQQMDKLADTFAQGLGQAATRLEEAAAAVNAG